MSTFYTHKTNLRVRPIPSDYDQPEEEFSSTKFSPVSGKAKGENPDQPQFQTNQSSCPGKVFATYSNHSEESCTHEEGSPPSFLHADPLEQQMISAHSVDEPYDEINDAEVRDDSNHSEESCTHEEGSPPSFLHADPLAQQMISAHSVDEPYDEINAAEVRDGEEFGNFSEAKDDTEFSDTAIVPDHDLAGGAEAMFSDRQQGSGVLCESFLQTQQIHSASMTRTDKGGDVSSRAIKRQCLSANEGRMKKKSETAFLSQSASHSVSDESRTSADRDKSNGRFITSGQDEASRLCTGKRHLETKVSTSVHARNGHRRHEEHTLPPSADHNDMYQSTDLSGTCNLHSTAIAISDRKGDDALNNQGDERLDDGGYGNCPVPTQATGLDALNNQGDERLDDGGYRNCPVSEQATGLCSNYANVYHNHWAVVKEMATRNSVSQCGMCPNTAEKATRDNRSCSQSSTPCHSQCPDTGTDVPGSRAEAINYACTDSGNAAPDDTINDTAACETVNGLHKNAPGEVTASAAADRVQWNTHVFLVDPQQPHGNHTIPRQRRSQSQSSIARNRLSDTVSSCGTMEGYRLSDTTYRGREAGNRPSNTPSSSGSFADNRPSNTSSSSGSLADNRPSNSSSSSGSLADNRPSNTSSSSGSVDGNSGSVDGNSGIADGNSGSVDGKSGIADGNSGSVDGNSGIADGNSGSVDGNSGIADGNSGSVADNRPSNTSSSSGSLADNRPSNTPSSSGSVADNRPSNTPSSSGSVADNRLSNTPSAANSSVPGEQDVPGCSAVDVDVYRERIRPPTDDDVHLYVDLRF